jgi:hypothetical protein
LSISSEAERGFRFFKFNSDFEFQRLAYRDYRERTSTSPTVAQLDGLISDPDWWDKPLGPKTAAWYGVKDSINPKRLVRRWRKPEIDTQNRHAGYLELSDKLKAAGLRDWEYDPARMGWASLLFPAHQKAADIARNGDEFGDEDLDSPEAVAVCWDRGKQRHSNCGGFDAYINPKAHNVFLRAVSEPDVRILDGECEWSLPNGDDAKIIEPSNVQGSSIKLPCSSLLIISVGAGKQIVVKLQQAGATAETTVSISDSLVVGVGDSFSSGEGNPDVPAKLRWAIDRSLDWAADGGTITDVVTAGPLRKASGDYFAAQWLDRSCHRSAYSYQLRSAMQLALADPSRAITFLSYACSGAEVNEGLFQPYIGPEKTDSKVRLDPSELAQFPLLLTELCKSYDGSNVLEKPLSPEDEREAEHSHQYHLGGVISDVAYRCAGKPAGQGFKRPIDLLYVSIGGNDLGFSRWILATITSDEFPTAFLPILKDDNAPECLHHEGSCTETRARWARFNSRFGLLREFIDHRLPFSNRGLTPVIMMTYPLPITDQTGSYCPDGNAGSTVWVRSKLRLCLTKQQKGLEVFKTISDFVDSHLNGSIDSLVADKDAHQTERPKWIAVKDYLSGFKGHGFCASKSKELSTRPIPQEPAAGCLTGNQTEAEILAIKKISGKAVQETLYFPLGVGDGISNFWPYDPIFDYQPYAHRARLARTMNEVQFLINQLNGANQTANAAGLLSLKDSAIFGAFHPTAEAHAMFADSFFTESKTILDKKIQP